MGYFNSLSLKVYQ